MDKRRARRMLVVSPSTLDRLIEAGHIPIVKVGLRAVRISREALERFIAERTEVRG